jgi:ATP-dependent DNA ligase
LYLDGVCLIGEPLERRRELLADVVPPDSRFRLSQTEERGDELFSAADLFKGLISVRKPIRATGTDERVTTWLMPKLICEVEYSARTSKGMLRNARLKRLRPDLSDL